MLKPVIHPFLFLGIVSSLTLPSLHASEGYETTGNNYIAPKEKDRNGITAAKDPSKMTNEEIMRENEKRRRININAELLPLHHEMEKDEPIDKLISTCKRECNNALTPQIKGKQVRVSCENVCQAEANDHLLTQRPRRKEAWCPKKVGRQLWDTFLDISLKSNGDYDCGGILSPRNKELFVEPSSPMPALGGASAVVRKSKKVHSLGKN